MPPDPPLTDGVIALRSWHTRDTAQLVAMFDDAEIARWTRAPTPYREADALEWLITQRALARRGSSLSLAIAEPGDDRLLGSITLRMLPDERGEFGYALARWARGRGAGTRALTLFSQWAFVAAGRERLEVTVEPENGRSLRLAERAGYRREGLLRSHHSNKGRRVDVVMLALLPGD